MRPPDFNSESFILSIRDYAKSPSRTMDLVEKISPLTYPLAPINVFTHVVNPLVESGYLKFISFKERDDEGVVVIRRGIVRTRRRSIKYLPGDLIVTLVNSRIYDLCQKLPQ